MIGLRGGAWEPGIFIAVPIVLLFFSYLFCFCVLIGVSSRSTVAAVLLTLLFWVGIWGVHTAEVILLTFQLTEESTAAHLDSQIQSKQELLTHWQRAAATQPTTRNSDYVKMYSTELKSDRDKRAEMHGTFVAWHQALFDVETILPKTNATVELLDRTLIRSARLQGVSRDNEDNSRNSGVDLNNNPVPIGKLNAILRSRTAGWIIGTSLAFEGIVLALAAWIFCRRDY